MIKSRRKFTAEFKSKVAIEALQEQETIEKMANFVEGYPAMAGFSSTRGIVIKGFSGFAKGCSPLQLFVKLDRKSPAIGNFHAANR